MTVEVASEVQQIHVWPTFHSDSGGEGFAVKISGLDDVPEARFGEIMVAMAGIGVRSIERRSGNTVWIVYSGYTKNLMVAKLKEVLTPLGVILQGGRRIHKRR